MSTIAAISTGRAPGGIGIVRISGENAVEVGDRIFSSLSGKRLCEIPGYTALYGNAVDGGGDIDTVVALVFKAPKSYTGEDVVELSCHGGLYVTDRVLKAALKAGAVPAEAGEFTKRAFLNGKMDLTSAESVMNLISAQGERAEKIALGVLSGRLFAEIKKITDKLLYDMALLSAWVDYPYEEIEDISPPRLKEHIDESIKNLEKLINDFDKGQIIMEGVDTAIVGCPNVGKSTLMNLLSGTEKSIVTEIAGTTRDIVEDTVNLGGITLRLSDTAGVRETEDTVESIGVERAVKKLEDASLVLAVFDASRPLSDEDHRLIELCKGKKAIGIINKTDLDKKYLSNEIEENFPQTVFISAKTGEGKDDLSSAVEKLLGTSDFDTSAAAVINERQRDCCRKACDALNDARNAVDMGLTLDAVTVCLDSAVESLMVLTGEKATELVVNEIFAQFCVGK
ncbi:MAG: tRNA uridine-5-carboxymethylaminomethyl(34) synthesis GTPase MnmE [Oscillospiraceae bacterium]|nr:tRNA uridine-5-carboxymethylaminomethyl(34) synthesis GTPase MnmE [Oscillospiraceae bacterium]